MPLKLDYHPPQPKSLGDFTAFRSLMVAVAVFVIVAGLNALFMYGLHIAGFWLFFIAPLANIFIAAGCFTMTFVIGSTTAQSVRLHMLVSLAAPVLATFVDWVIAFSMLPVC